MLHAAVDICIYTEWHWTFRGRLGKGKQGEGGNQGDFFFNIHNKTVSEMHEHGDALTAAHYGCSTSPAPAGGAGRWGIYCDMQPANMKSCHHERTAGKKCLFLNGANASRNNVRLKTYATLCPSVVVHISFTQWRKNKINKKSLRQRQRTIRR